MAVKIKKKIIEPDGSTLEIEGTPHEVEEFLRRREEKRGTDESTKKNKKDILYGKAKNVCRNVSTPELRKWWDDVERTAAEVAAWPGWKKIGLRCETRTFGRDHYDH